MSQQPRVHRCPSIGSLGRSVLGIVIIVLRQCLLFGYLDPEGK